MILESYLLALSDLSDEQIIRATRYAVQQLQFFPTPVELRGLAGAPTTAEEIAKGRREADPEFIALPAPGEPELYLLPQKATKTPEEYKAEHARLHAELRETWRRLEEERRANPHPGPGMKAASARLRRARRIVATYTERSLADALLLDVDANMADGWQQYSDNRRGLAATAKEERQA